DYADAATRAAVVDALRHVAESPHRDIRHYGMEILAALPSDESAPLVEIAASWLDRDVAFGTLIAADKLLKKLAANGQGKAALRIAEQLLQIWDNSGEVVSLFGRHMYEHHLPPIMEVLTRACGSEALRLFMGLLIQAAQIGRKIEYDHFSLRSISDD